MLIMKLEGTLWKHNPLPRPFSFLAVLMCKTHLHQKFNGFLFCPRSTPPSRRSSLVSFCVILQTEKQKTLNTLISPLPELSPWQRTNLSLWIHLFFLFVDRVNKHLSESSEVPKSDNLVCTKGLDFMQTVVLCWRLLTQLCDCTKRLGIQHLP